MIGAPRLAPHRGADSGPSAIGAGIFIRTARQWDRPTVTSSRFPAVSNADCLRGMTAARPARPADLPAAVTTAVHLRLDLKEGSGVFEMADNRCVFS